MRWCECSDASRAAAIGSAAALLVASCTLLTDTDGIAGIESARGVDASRLQDAIERDAPDPRVVEGGADAPVVNKYRNAILADAPLAYFPFDEPSGAPLATDVVGAKVAAVFDTGVTFGAPGIVGSAVGFGGTGYLKAGDVLDWIGDAPVTIEFWIKVTPTSANDQLVLQKRAGDDSGLSGFVFYIHGVPPIIQLEAWRVSGTRSAWMTLPDAGFVHVVYTYDPDGGPHLYTNAVQTSTAYPGSGGAPDTSAPLRIGEQVVGFIDELAFYDHAISPERVAAHYGARK